MTDTIISSATKEVAIGFGRPFVMIGERINPTGRKLLAEEMKNGDFSRVVSDAIAQVEAGAQMLDVNAGIPLADEPALLVRAIQEGPGGHRRADRYRLLDRRGPRGRHRDL
jgi:5-methyltetrahydrofolate--homocysteine methyltransferase